MYGKIITTPPAGYLSRFQWPEYKVISDIPTDLSPQLIGTDPIGTYRGIWPIYAEEYFSDAEPISTANVKTLRNRIIMWNRIFRTDVPNGWHQFSRKASRLEGLATLDKPNYFAIWSESARRYRKKWLEECLDKLYTLERISLEEFDASYMQSSVAGVMKRMFPDALRRKMEAGAQLELWGTRNITTGEIGAGMATITSKQNRASFYLCGFILTKHGHSPLMLGLIDHWYKQSLSQQIHYLHFGQFWLPGKDKDWKGFSEFKAKFGLEYIECPPTLWRFAKGKLF